MSALTAGRDTAGSPVPAETVVAAAVQLLLGPPDETLARLRWPGVDKEYVISGRSTDRGW